MITYFPKPMFLAPIHPGAILAQIHPGLVGALALYIPKYDTGPNPPGASGGVGYKNSQNMTLIFFGGYLGPWGP